MNIILKEIIEKRNNRKMEIKTKNCLVTGAAGFIGSNFTNYMAKKYVSVRFVVLDILDYCSSLENLEKLPNIEIVVGDIANSELVGYILRKFKIDSVVHFAAQSHVDNSFYNSIPFTKTNVLGTHILLETIRLYHEDTHMIQKIIHVSSDEVYGETKDNIAKTESSAFDPTSMYAASKAAVEMFVKAYYHSFKMPVIIARGNNCFGPQQYPEKVIPKFICQLLNNEKITIQGQGTAQRNFIHVDDTCTAFETILLKGEIGEIYNISADHSNEFTVMQLANILINMIKPGQKISDHIEYIEDRKFNDARYYICSEKLEKLGWKPFRINFKEELIQLIDWYKINKIRYNF